MNQKELNELLNRRVKSPAPDIQADPFLPTRIEAIVREGKQQFTTPPGAITSWSLASVLAACAVVIGIYIGSNLSTTSVASDSSTELITEYTSAFYQSGFADDWHGAFENGDSK